MDSILVGYLSFFSQFWKLDPVATFKPIYALGTNSCIISFCVSTRFLTPTQKFPPLLLIEGVVDYDFVRGAVGVVHRGGQGLQKSRGRFKDVFLRLVQKQHWIWFVIWTLPVMKCSTISIPLLGPCKRNFCFKLQALNLPTLLMTLIFRHLTKRK